MLELLQTQVMPRNGEEFLALLRGYLSQARDAIDVLKRDPSLSAQERLARFDTLSRGLADGANLAGLLQAVHPEQAIKEAAEIGEQEISRLATDLSLDPELFAVFAPLDLAKSEEPLEARLLRKILLDFKRAGVDRDDETRARIKALNEKLVEISQAFERNIRDDTRFVKAAPAKWAGLPEDFLSAHPTEEDGTRRFSTDPSDVMPVLIYADDAALREALYRTRLSRAPKNEAVLKELLATRHELAQLLGYENYAAYSTETKMIKTPKAARAFIEEVERLSKERAKADYDDLLEQKRQKAPEANDVHPWDREYLQRAYKAARHDFDPASLRQYFEVGAVKRGILDISAELFGLRFTLVPEAARWHEDVKVYDVTEESGRPLGAIYLDLYPRPGKFKHAAMFSVREGTKDVQLPAGAIVANFPDPTKAQGARALLEHDQVETFFHEFGHLLHHILGGHSRFARFSGVATEWDFVEVPSQLYENWAWEPAILARFAKNEAGQAVPKALIQRAKAAESVGRGLFVTQQMFYAILALSYYDRDPQGFSPRALSDELQAAYTRFPPLPGLAFENTFGHLDGYASNYYTYMWSLAIVKDIEARFKAAGFMDRELATRYKNAILAPGGERDAAELVFDFLGRDWTLDAFRTWLVEN